MKISNKRIGINSQCLSPSLQLDVDIEFEDAIEVPISITGTIMSTDNKVVSYLSENPVSHNLNFGIKLLTKLERDKIIRERNTQVYTASLTAELSQRAIEYIELRRERDTEKSVRFEVQFFIKHIEIRTEPDKLLDPDRLPKDDFMNVRMLNLRHYVEIKQSDWIQHYAPYLGIGNYILLELMIPNEINIPLFWEELYDALSRNVKDMEGCLRSGDWQKVMFFARKFYENAKIGDDKKGHEEFKKRFNELMMKDQHCQTGVEDLYTGIWKFFDFYSKYSHDQDKKGNIKPLPVSRKEDAYFAYSTAIGLLNLIGSKISRE